jgi:hypothetical protein
MLDLQNVMMEALQHLGALEISALVVVVILLSVWLIVRVIGRKTTQTAPGGQRNVVSEQVSAPAPNVVANKPLETLAVESILTAKEVAAVQTGAVSAVPEDSVLHRHYDAMQQHSEPAPVVQTGAKVGYGSVNSQPSFPQDSVLRRHFISQLQAEIEAAVAPRPSDSVLLRHHQALVTAELEKRLSAFNG